MFNFFSRIMKCVIMHKRPQNHKRLAELDEKLDELDKRQHRVRNRAAVIEFEAYGGPHPRRREDNTKPPNLSPRKT